MDIIGIFKFAGMIEADEPAASLDTHTGKSLVELMFGVGKENGCTAIVSIYGPEVIKLADTTIHLEDGRVVA